MNSILSSILNHLTHRYRIHDLHMIKKFNNKNSFIVCSPLCCFKPVWFADSRVPTYKATQPQTISFNSCRVCETGETHSEFSFLITSLSGSSTVYTAELHISQWKRSRQGHVIPVKQNAFKKRIFYNVKRLALTHSKWQWLITDQININ